MQFNLWCLLCCLTYCSRKTCCWSISELSKRQTLTFIRSNIFDSVFSFEESESYNERFEAVDLGGSNYIKQIGTLFLVIVFYPILRLLLAILKLSTCMGKYLNFPSFTIEATLFTLETCIELTFVMTLNTSAYRRLSQSENLLEFMDYVYTIIFSTCICIMPLFIIIFYNIKKTHWQE